jgi:hypothetical protein
MSLNIFPIAAKTLMFGLALLLPVFAQTMSARAQEVAETIRLHTRVVFMDALVKDKRTGVPISDLKPENFEVFDEGKPRSISYCTREGELRKPLALVLVLDLRDDGAGRFLKRPEILEIMAAELAKLSPEDEVAIMAVNIGEDENRKMLTDFTRDRNQIAAALKQVPTLMVSEDEKIRAMIHASGPDTPASDNNSDRIKGDKTEANNGPVTSQVELNKSGGEAVQVSRTSDYGRGLSKIIGNLTARYSLGFTLAEEEKDDGQLHNLEIRVKAKDAKGKLRKLEVNSRRGYYMTTATAKETTAAKAQ